MSDASASQPAASLVDAVPVTELEGWLQMLMSLGTGGLVLLLLLILSIVAFSLVLGKLMQFLQVQLWQGKKSAEQALRLWQHNEWHSAQSLADTNPHPAGQALARAIRGVAQQLPEAQIREEVIRYGSDALFQLRRGLRTLEVIASLAPLIGLLGTVLGMIDAFQQLEASGSRVDPSILSSGIWQALLTTAGGLIVAIPVVILLNWLERQIDNLAHQMD
ncbi:MAG: MotA/TolQ/ExbB proton channel family protein, partial [Oceanobacter sp.]